MPGASQKTTCYVIAYDISDDRRRSKVHKTLSGFGRWTQYSLFECFLTAKEQALLRDKLDRLLEPEEDSVRFYPLCQGCLAKVKTVGGPKPEEETVFVV
jgi:CRISPR-associated protein Cas2